MHRYSSNPLTPLINHNTHMLKHYKKYRALIKLEFSKNNNFAKYTCELLRKKYNCKEGIFFDTKQYQNCIGKEGQGIKILDTGHYTMYLPFYIGEYYIYVFRFTKDCDLKYIFTSNINKEDS